MINPAMEMRVTGLPATPAEAAAVQVGKIEQAAQGFEAVLVRQMLRELRQSSLNTSKSDVHAAYLQIGDEHLANHLVQSGGLGFAKAMASQMLEQIRLAQLIASPEMAVNKQ